MRKVVANILRMVADSMLPGTLASQPVMRVRYLDWLRDTYTFLRSVAPLTEGFWEVSQVGDATRAVQCIYMCCSGCDAPLAFLGIARTTPPHITANLLSVTFKLR